MEGNVLQAKGQNLVKYLIYLLLKSLSKRSKKISHKFFSRTFRS